MQVDYRIIEWPTIYDLFQTLSDNNIRYLHAAIVNFAEDGHKL